MRSSDPVTARRQGGAVVAVAAAAIVAAVGAVRWRYCVVTVRGASMEPGLSDGDRLLARRCGLRGLRCGRLVVFREPGLAGSRPAWRTGAAQDVWVIKRVAALPGDLVPDTVRPAASGTPTVPPGAIVVLGDSAESRDSRQWGFIPASHVYGVGERRLSRGRLASPAGNGQ
jgi:signal peptidase I